MRKNSIRWRTSRGVAFRAAVPRASAPRSLRSVFAHVPALVERYGDCESCWPCSHWEDPRFRSKPSTGSPVHIFLVDTAIPRITCDERSHAQRFPPQGARCVNALSSSTCIRAGCRQRLFELHRLHRAAAIRPSDQRCFPLPGNALPGPRRSSRRQRCSTFGFTSNARATSPRDTPCSSRRTAAGLNSFVNCLRDKPMTQFSIQ